MNLGNRTNQNFVAIPYKTLIDMIRYKAALKGIEVKVVEEGYTSGTSYLDGEFPEAASYDRKRRIKRGLFKSNSGTCINNLDIPSRQHAFVGVSKGSTMRSSPLSDSR